MNYPTLDTAELSGKKVLLRAGFDVPMEDGKVADTTRIEAIVPTMKHILDAGGSLILLAHQGRPTPLHQGYAAQEGEPVPEFSQKPLAPVLEKLLGKTVHFVSRCVGAQATEVASNVQSGEVVLLENVRYEAGEKSKDTSERDALGEQLAALADVYVNDAFTNCHRDHASMTSVPKFMDQKYIGFNVQKEIEGLSLVTENPKQPVTLIISGAKAETKVPVIENFLTRAQDIIVGGCVTNTLLASKGIDIQSSRYDEDYVAKGKEILDAGAHDDNATVHVPDFVVCATSPDGQAHEVPASDIPDGEAIFDIGLQSVEAYAEIIRNSGTIVWNGPIGMYEKEQFARATKAIAAAVQEATAAGAVSVLGGGDTLDFHERYGVRLDNYTYVSTAGGAMLDFISGKPLPALEALKL